MAVFNKALFIRQAVGQTQRPCQKKVGRQWRWDLSGRLTASVRSSCSSWKLNVTQHCTWHGQSCDLLQLTSSSEHEKSSLSLANHSSHINPVCCKGLYTLYKTTAVASLPIIHSSTVLRAGLWPVTGTIQPGLSPKVTDLPPPQVVCCARDTMENKDGPFMRKTVTGCKPGLEEKKSRAEWFFSKRWGAVFRLIIFQRYKNLVLIFELRNYFFSSQKYVNNSRVLEVIGFGSTLAPLPKSWAPARTPLPLPSVTHICHSVSVGFVLCHRSHKWIIMPACRWNRPNADWTKAASYQTIYKPMALTSVSFSIHCPEFICHWNGSRGEQTKMGTPSSLGKASQTSGP